MGQEHNNQPDDLEKALAEEYSVLQTAPEDTPERYALIKQHIKRILARLEAGEFDTLHMVYKEYHFDAEIADDKPTYREPQDVREKVAYYITACHGVFITGDNEIEEVLDIASDWELPDTVCEHKEGDWNRMKDIVESW